MGPPGQGGGGGGATSKFQTACSKEMKQSLRCMETGDKDKCADLIETYKDCRKAEQDRIKAARNPSGGFKW